MEENFDKEISVLQGFDGLAARHGIGGSVLCHHQKLSERRNVWIGYANKTGGYFCGSEYRRRTWPRKLWGLCSISENSVRVVERIGNTSDYCAKGGYSSKRNGFAVAGGMRRTWKNVACAYSIHSGKKDIEGVASLPNPHIKTYSLFATLYSLKSTGGAAHG